MNKDSILVFDITRDIFTGVVELEPGSFIMDPLEAAGIIDDLTTEYSSEDRIASILGPVKRKVSYRACRDVFFDEWKGYFREFAQFSSEIYKDVFLAEIFFTCEVDDPSAEHILDRQFCSEVNATLEKMYEFVRQFSNIQIFGVDRQYLITGCNVAWGGPTYTHFIDEVYALYTVSLRQAMRARGLNLGDNYDDFDPLRTGAIERAKKYASTEAAKVRAEERLKHLEIRFLQGAHAQVAESAARIEELESAEALAKQQALEVEEAVRLAHAQVAESAARIEELEGELANFSKGVGLRAIWRAISARPKAQT